MQAPAGALIDISRSKRAIICAAAYSDRRIDHSSIYVILFSGRRIASCSRSTAPCMVFHLANADMLPLVGQKLALQNKNEGTALMAGRILLAQVVMVPMAMMVGRKADFSGRKPLFLAGLAVPCLRALFYPL
jgi:hypothetical protein